MGRDRGEDALFEVSCHMIDELANAIIYSFYSDSGIDINMPLFCAFCIPLGQVLSAFSPVRTRPVPLLSCGGPVKSKSLEAIKRYYAGTSRHEAKPTIFS